ncbi:hypothetical protein GCM10018785_50990 [Streptomyces longispororuber]|uniref:Uncharacterized protein n=1 Tax=Streptomyces longispororuber TaxID=68230 RepID=A0A918ZY74_9ACTN|nr:hypothetical protein GCM10018785_50990 [Streptomyces longispororuber]
MEAADTVRLVVEDRADVEAAHHALGVDLLEGRLQPLAGLRRFLQGRDPERGVALLQAELLVPGGDLVRFELTEEQADGARHGARLTVVVRRVLVRRLHARGLGEEPLRFRHGVVAPDQHAQRGRLRGPLVRRKAVLRAGDLEGGDLVVPVVEQFVVGLGRGGQLVERVVDGRIVLARPAFDRGEMAVERGLDRLGGGAYLGSGGLRSIRHSADAIRTGPVPAQ